jgi:uncharacterized protein (DUF433 family)
MAEATIAEVSTRLEALEKKILRLEEIIQTEKGAAETPAPPWNYLVFRPHPWRRQLYIKGRNLTARQLVGGIKANHLDEATAARDYHLPIEAIREALTYVEQNKALLEAESEAERLLLKRGGAARGPQAVP